MAERGCNGCSLCCELVSVKEIDKPSFTRCQHQRDLLTAHPGCAIYAERPYSCRAWSCLWLSDATWPDESRPDRCGFVVDQMIDVVRINGKEWPCAQIWVREGREEAFREPLAQNVIASLVGKKLAVLWRIPGDLARCFCKEPGRPGISYNDEWIKATADMGSDSDRFARADKLTKGLRL